jgi:hypothetical protein
MKLRCSRAGRFIFSRCYTYDGSFYATSDEDPLSIPYLKLHGSFNWYYCWRCEYFEIVSDPDIGLNCTLLPEGCTPVSVGHLRACNSALQPQTPENLR